MLIIEGERLHAIRPDRPPRRLDRLNPTPTERETILHHKQLARRDKSSQFRRSLDSIQQLAYPTTPQLRVSYAWR